MDTEELFKKAYNTAIKKLVRREHSEYEIKHFLKTKGYTTSIVSLVINQLNEHNYLSEKRYAEFIYRHYRDNQYGFRRINYELQQKKVNPKYIELIKDQDDADWHEIALKRLYKKNYPKPMEAKDKMKAQRYLYSRGFTSTTINQVINTFNKKNDH